MSAAQILDEMPKLSRAERRLIAERALELNWDDAEREAMLLAEASGLELLQFIDHTEGHEAADRAR